MLIILPAAASAAPGDNVRDEEISREHLTVLGVTIGRHTLDDASSRLGPANVFQHGPGGAASFRICYTSTDEHVPSKVVFEAGPQSQRREITTIKIIRGDVKYEDAAKCSMSGKVSATQGTKSGIRLGMTAKELRDMFGEPTEKRDGVVEYEFHTRKRLSKSEVERLAKTWPYVKRYPYFDLYSSVVAWLHEGKVVRLNLSRIETR